MSTRDKTDILMPSILDRLIDEEPEKSSEGLMSASQTLASLKDSLQRDLSSLLNTRTDMTRSLEGFPELEKSIYSFGLPDFTNFTVGVHNAENFVSRAVKEAIERFEPRLTNVEVVAVGKINTYDRRINLVIRARLAMEPYPDLVFRSVLETSTGQFSVLDDAGGSTG